MAERARLASPMSGAEVLDSPEHEPGLVAPGAEGTTCRYNFETLAEIICCKFRTYLGENRGV